MTLSSADHALIEPIETAPSLDRTLGWAAINSGSRNIAGLAEVAARIADEFAVLPGEIALVDPVAVEAMAADGSLAGLPHGGDARRAAGDRGEPVARPARL